MNVLEHYIIEIHKENKFEMPFTDNCICVEADITVDCYGVVKRTTYVCLEQEWENTKHLGYYLE